MAKSERASKRTSKSQKSKADESDKKVMRMHAIHAIDRLHQLRDTLLAFECLQALLSPQCRNAFEGLDIVPNQLRSLLNCVNAETRRRVRAADEAMETMRQVLP